jgi:hypothetical protein
VTTHIIISRNRLIKISKIVFTTKNKGMNLSFQVLRVQRH